MTHVFHFHLFVALMLYCKSVDCPQVQYTVHMFILILHLTYFSVLQRDIDCIFLMAFNKFYNLTR